MVCCLVPPFALVGMLAVKDLLRVISTMREGRVKRLLQAVVAVTTFVSSAPLIWVRDEYMYDDDEYVSLYVMWLGLLPMLLIVYAWATLPSEAAARRPIQYSRVALLYLKYFGINGRVSAVRPRAQRWRANVKPSPPPPPPPPPPTSVSIFTSRCRSRSCCRWYCRPGQSCRC